MNTRPDPKIASRALSVSREAALTGGLAHTGVSRPGILPAIERSLISSAVAVPCSHSPRKRKALSLRSSPDLESYGLPVYAGVFQAPGSLRGTMASADPPSGCPVGISPGKSALVAAPYGCRCPAGQPVWLRSAPGTTAAFTSATEPFDFAVWCRLAASPAALVCGSCPSARPVCRAGTGRRFPLSFLPPGGYPAGVGLAWSFFTFSRAVLSTGDLHAVYTTRP